MNEFTLNKVKYLVEENNRLQTLVERLKWKNHNQKNEIRRLNRAHIEKNNIISARESQLELFRVNSLNS